MTKSVLAWLLLGTSTALAAGYQPKVIYGNDDRYDVNEVPVSLVREVADSTLAMIRVSGVQPNAQGGFDIPSRSYGEQGRLCRDERFFDQPAAASCSAFYLGADLIATAGHCIQESTCAREAFVFGYRMGNDGSAPMTASANDVYRCKAVVAREFTRAQDYAIVQLDRPVVGHRPLALSRKGVQANDPLVVIGHPAGLPTKVAPNAGVRRVMPEYFVANLDTYGGNSGSAVFDARTLEVVGILVRGERDFVYDSARSCTMSNRCQDGACRGEDVTHIKYVGEALERIGFFRR
ncbi:MAG: trypsin-like peptidase domain-containing protein [Bdellovibrionaceae bacterium]|nr:trypsin-like peptidase domain-containing protein [Pseudobdellovibrionaceae bacterium]